MRAFFTVLFLFASVAHAEDRLLVYTVNYPLQYFAQRIAGDRAEVVYPGPADQDPAFWKPSSDRITDYQRADLVLLNGASYAKWVDRVSLPRSRIVDTSKAFREQYIRFDDSPTHSHGPGGDHAHSGTASTTWLDFFQAVQQAEAIQQALSRSFPASRAEFERNFEELRKDLMALDLELQKMFAAHRGRPLLASHPVYQYLARRYGLHLASLSLEPGTALTEQDWNQLVSLREEMVSGWMLWEAQPLAETVQRLSSMDIEVLVFDPCAVPPAQGDFLSIMQANINTLQKMFE